MASLDCGRGLHSFVAQDGGGTDAPLRTRELLFARYPSAQTAVAFALALLVALACSFDPAAASYEAIRRIDPDATGALYIGYEVLLSFSGRSAAPTLFAFAALAVLPIRAVVFGAPSARKPSALLPAFAFACCMVVGKSYDAVGDASLVLGGVSRVAASLIAAAGWFVFGLVGITLLFALFDEVGELRARAGERGAPAPVRAGWRLLERRPFIVPFAVLVAAWAPTLLASTPGVFMGDTGDQIRQWFGLPSGTSSYLKLIDSDVVLNGHHPVAHTALLGGCVQLGMTLVGDENAGLFTYTVLQFTATAACAAYLVSTLKRLGVEAPARAAVLAFLALVPLFSNYAVLITKDVLFADALALLVAQVAKLLAPHGGEGDGPGPASWERRDEALLVMACLGTAFLRNGGVVFSVVACAPVVVIRLRDARRVAPAAAYACRRAARAALVASGVALVAHLAFTAVVMPDLHLTPGSRREVLSIPFQQTARYVEKHDGVHAGIAGGADDGSVSEEERTVIDRVLGYDTLASRYVPTKSDAVKNGFNEYASADDLAAYLRVWAAQLLRDPACYLSATIANYYGYVYPSERVPWMYTTASSDKIMARADNREHFDFHRWITPATEALDQAVGLYRTAWLQLPVLSLTMTSAPYVWALVLVVIYLLRERRWRSCALVAPLVAVLAVCLIGPCNGATYLRYLYPVIFALPFAAAAALDMRTR